MSNPSIHLFDPGYSEEEVRRLRREVEFLRQGLENMTTQLSSLCRMSTHIDTNTLNGSVLYNLSMDFDQVLNVIKSLNNHLIQEEFICHRCGLTLNIHENNNPPNLCFNEGCPYGLN